MNVTNPSIRNPSIRVVVGPGAPEEGSPGRQQAESPQPSRVSTPPIDIHEGPDGLILEADLPGATDKDLFVQLEDNVLSLRAHVQSPVPQSARPIHEEFSVGDFHRSFILSDEVDRDRITAELKNGVLRLILPRADRARSRRIEIRS
ncbi:Spore protein SP21 [Aquisphaera giovannonii]|uniref:Spore protein SP21 n=1 Tax=Aquisphaera giovannonii TaxID=406548 RepID=A0A5B9VXZ4_9BACT|nr:Hsp20/alpha crystallin family protein [Aquisphaera giovannonii]QEH33213.1 Spore protein SP21 [Aquisphaera giovannonii]